MNQKFNFRFISPDDILNDVEQLLTSDVNTVLSSLKNILDNIREYGINKEVITTSTGTINFYINQTMDSIEGGLDVTDAISNLLRNLESALNRVNGSKGDLTMKTAELSLYNPSFDPGMDAGTCVELSGKLLGVAFSELGIKNLLDKEGAIISIEDIRNISAEAGVIIAGDTDDTFTADEYADRLFDAYSHCLDEGIHKSSKITWRHLIKGYRNLSKQAGTNTPFYDGKSDSELRSLLLTVVQRKKTTPVFDLSAVDKMSREELIDAIDKQQATPTVTAAFDDIDDSSLLDSLTDESLQSENVIQTLLKDGFDIPLSDVSSTDISQALMTGSHMVQTDDEDIRMYYDENDGYSIVSDADAVEEYFGPEEFEDAYEFLLELLSRRVLKAEGAKIPPERLKIKPTSEELKWAKYTINEGSKLLDALDKAIDEAIANVEKAMGVDREAVNADRDRAYELVLRALYNNPKAKTMKLGDDLYASIEMAASGGSQSIAKFRELIVKELNVDKNTATKLQARAKTDVVMQARMILKKDKGLEEENTGTYYVPSEIETKKESSKRIISSYDDEIAQAYTVWAYSIIDDIDAMADKWEAIRRQGEEMFAPESSLDLAASFKR